MYQINILIFTELVSGSEVHVGRSRRRFIRSWRTNDFIAEEVIKVIQWTSSSCFGCPIRMVSELQDDVNRCLLKEERIKWRAVKEGLHLETLQVTKPPGWILAQKLHQRMQQMIVTNHGDFSVWDLDYKPQWAVRSEQSCRTWGGHTHSQRPPLTL